MRVESENLVAVRMGQIYPAREFYLSHLGLGISAFCSFGGR